MPIPTAVIAQKRMKLRAVTDRTMVTLKWTEWPTGSPDIDPTTGARPVMGDVVPIAKTASIRAFVHIVAPMQSGYRRFAEISSGDAIVDFPLDLIQITDPGDTAFAVGDVVDEIAFSQANRALGDDGDSALGTIIEPSDLSNVGMEFGGHKWVQKEVGEELIKNWDALYAGLSLTRAMLMTTTK